MTHPIHLVSIWLRLLRGSLDLVGYHCRWGCATDTAVVWWHRRDCRHGWNNSLAPWTRLLLDYVVDVIAKTLSSGQSINEVLRSDGLQTGSDNPILKLCAQLRPKKVCYMVKVLGAKMLGDLTACCFDDFVARVKESAAQDRRVGASDGSVYLVPAIRTWLTRSFRTEGPGQRFCSWRLLCLKGERKVPAG